MYIIFLKINFPDNAPPTVESYRDFLGPDELAWVYKELGVKKHSKRQLARERYGEIANPIEFYKCGRSVRYPIKNVDKRLKELWERGLLKRPEQ